MPKTKCYLILATACLVGTWVTAATAPLVLITGKSSEVNLIRFSYGLKTGLRAEFQSVEGNIHVDSSQFIRWGNANNPTKRESIKLSDGSILFASENWTSDRRVTLKNNALTLYRSSAKLEFDRRSISKIITNWKASSEKDPNQLESVDILHLKNGDQITGEVIELDSNTIRCSVLGETITIATSDINHIDFHPEQSDEVDTSSACLIGLSDGSILYAHEARNVKERYQIRLACGQTVECQLDEIVYLQPLVGAVTYLSDLKPVDYRHTPYLSLNWPYGADQMPFGGPLVSNSQIYKKGISLHSAARIVYAVRPSDKRFQTIIALADGAKNSVNQSQRSVDYQILAIKADKLDPLVKGSLVGPSPQPVSIDEDISQARAIVIVIDYGLGADVGDDVLLLDARFVNDLP